MVRELVRYMKSMNMHGEKIKKPIWIFYVMFWWSGGSKAFQARKSLFASLKYCSSVHNLKFDGETYSIYYESVEGFLSVLNKITEENGYLLELVFVADKSGVMLKWIPVHMFIQKIEKFDF